MSVQPLAMTPEPAAMLSRWEIIGGIVLPLLSAAAQALLLRSDTVGPWLAWLYAPLGIAALLAATKVRANLVWRSLICGANLGCAAGWLLTALDHLLYSYFFVYPFAFVALALLPGTAIEVNAARAVTLWRQGIGLHWSHVVALGAALTFLPPAAAQLAETRWVAATLAQLSALDADTAAAALRALNRYPLRLGRFAGDVCQFVVIGRTDAWDTNDELLLQLAKMLGPDPWHCEPRDPHG